MKYFLVNYKKEKYEFNNKQEIFEFLDQMNIKSSLHFNFYFSNNISHKLSESKTFYTGVFKDYYFTNNFNPTHQYSIRKYMCASHYGYFLDQHGYKIDCLEIWQSYKQSRKIKTKKYKWGFIPRGFKPKYKHTRKKAPSSAKRTLIIPNEYSAEYNIKMRKKSIIKNPIKNESRDFRGTTKSWKNKKIKKQYLKYKN